MASFSIVCLTHCKLTLCIYVKSKESQKWKVDGMWKATSVQMAFFVSTSTAIDAEKLYTDAYGVEPNSAQKNRVVSPTNPILSQALGSDDDLQYIIQVQPGRVDFFVTPAEKPEKSVDPYANLIETRHGLSMLMQAAENCAEQLASLRVAIIANLAEPVSSYQEGSAKVAEMIGTALPLSDGSDIQFQWNVPIAWDRDYRINRLLRVAILGFQQVAFQNAVGQPLIPISEEKFATSLMIDVNTVPLPVSFPEGVSKAALQEIHRIVIGLAESRDPFGSLRNG